MAPETDNPLLCFYGDDFTGSTDALESLAQAGARSVLFLEQPTPERLARYPGLQAVGIAGMTRSMTPDALETVLRPALTALRGLGAPHVHYKVCSTFDSSPAIGSIGRVIDIGSSIFGAPFVPLVVGAPALGRYCVFGNLFACLGQVGEAFRLDRHPSMSRHPITPADESDLRRHLGRQTTRTIALFDILKVSLPDAEAEAALERLLLDRPQIVLFDVLYPQHLDRIGRLLAPFGDPGSPLFLVGSSAVEDALASRWAATGLVTPAERWPGSCGVGPVLVASGSCSPVTAKQIERALKRGFAQVALDTVSLAAGTNASEAEEAAADQATGHLRAGRSVIVHTSLGQADPRISRTIEQLAAKGSDKVRADSGRLIGGVLSRVIRQTVMRTGVRRLIVAGGDTSGHVARALGIEALEMIAPMARGAPLCRAHAPGSSADGLEVVFKGGQIGGDDFFCHL